jgi:hypothetical protein
VPCNWIFAGLTGKAAYEDDCGIATMIRPLLIKFAGAHNKVAGDKHHQDDDGHATTIHVCILGH